MKSSIWPFASSFLCSLSWQVCFALGWWQDTELENHWHSILFAGCSYFCWLWIVNLLSLNLQEPCFPLAAFAYAHKYWLVSMVKSISLLDYWGKVYKQEVMLIFTDADILLLSSKFHARVETHIGWRRRQKSLLITLINPNQHLPITVQE